jgi:N-acyl homoserine lactone hydrolase
MTRPFAFLTSLALMGMLSGCVVTSHPTQLAALGQSRSSSEFEAVIDKPGPITFEKIKAADWISPLSGLLNLKHPKSKTAGLKNKDEPIQINFYALRHPTRGLFLVDTGVHQAERQGNKNSLLSGLVGKAIKAEKIKIHMDTATWLANNKEKVAGVFLTHLHVDHILGFPDIPKGMPIYVGPGEASARQLQNIFVQGITNKALEGHAPVEQLRFEPDSEGRFAGVSDIFGDGSVWALYVPGHTLGSISIVARTTHPFLTPCVN